MDEWPDVGAFLDGGNDVVWANRRLPTRTYLSRSFALDMRNSPDHGLPARFVTKVFDEQPPTDDDPEAGDQPNQDEEWVVTESPGHRKQVKLMVAREAGQVRELTIEKVANAASGAVKNDLLLRLNREQAGRLIDLIKALDHIPIEGDTSSRVDDAILHEISQDPQALQRIYDRDPDGFRQLIAQDASAEDAVAVARRRKTVEHFRAMLEDPDYFAAAAADHQGRKEAVWQALLEENPWILGGTLSGQLFTSWDNDRLEQVVAGFTVAGAGKRTDALMVTNGRIRAMAFAEIKHHETPLIGTQYRPDCWAASAELSGGVTQLQQTVHKATQSIGGRLAETDATGAETGEHTYLVRPRSYLIVGNLAQLRGETGVHRAKYESFELYRRNLIEPEVLTFDELLARAEWHVTLLDGEL